MIARSGDLRRMNAEAAKLPIAASIVSSSGLRDREQQQRVQEQREGDQDRRMDQVDAEGVVREPFGDRPLRVELAAVDGQHQKPMPTQTSASHRHLPALTGLKPPE